MNDTSHQPERRKGDRRQIPTRDDRNPETEERRPGMVDPRDLTTRAPGGDVPAAPKR